MLALEEAIQIVRKQETWDVNDDLCDCSYQFQGYWNNPYIGVTYEVRLCCLYAELEKTWPHLFRRTVIEPAEWNGEADMPRSIYHRQLANLQGVSVSEARMNAGEPPKGKSLEAVPFILLIGGEEMTLDLAKVRFR